MTLLPDELGRQIKKAALDIGYVACGITHASPFDDYERRVHEHIKRFPEAVHLYAPMLARVDPRRNAPWARSIIVCLRYYGKYDLPRELIGHIGRNYLADRRTAVCGDSSMPTRMNAALAQLGLRYRRGGCPDRAAAIRAGVARLGKNCFAYADNYGSWINIETWRVDAELPPDEPATGCPCPAECHRCLAACPTRAIVEPFVMCMTRCVAYLTFRAPEPIESELARKMGGWIYGCDVCQEVCPLNRGAWRGSEPASWLLPLVRHLTPQALATMDEETYQRVVHPLFPYIPLDNLARWHRNAKRALAHARAAPIKDTD